MVDLPWFETRINLAPLFRERRALGLRPSVIPDFFRPHPSSRVNGHQAVEWLEEYVDGRVDDDRLFVAERYFVRAEYLAEGDRFETPDERRDEQETSYGAAYWLHHLPGDYPEKWNILDYYLASFPGVFYRWAGWRPLHPDHQAVAIGLIDDILGYPGESPPFDPVWRTPVAVAIASTMYQARDFTAAPILGDALEEAGCDDAAVLDHLRTERLHVRGCWVVDRVLGRVRRDLNRAGSARDLLADA